MGTGVALAKAIFVNRDKTLQSAALLPPEPQPQPPTRPDKQVIAMEAVTSNVESDLGSFVKPQVIYRCKKCRRIVASQEHVLPHERGGGQKCFKWKKRSGAIDAEPPDCSSIFVEPMKWMESVNQYGCVEDKIQCMGCKTRLGSFNWAGMQCNCGKWINPAFQLHKSRIDECPL